MKLNEEGTRKLLITLKLKIGHSVTGDESLSQFDILHFSFPVNSSIKSSSLRAKEEFKKKRQKSSRSCVCDTFSVKFLFVN